MDTYTYATRQSTLTQSTSRMAQRLQFSTPITHTSTLSCAIHIPCSTNSLHSVRVARVVTCFNQTSNHTANTALSHDITPTHTLPPQFDTSAPQQLAVRPNTYTVQYCRHPIKNRKRRNGVALLDVLAVLCGAPKQIRTADLLITNQLLYQLSYEGM